MECKLKRFTPSQVVLVVDAMNEKGHNVESFLCKDCLLFHIRKIPQFALEEKGSTRDANFNSRVSVRDRLQSDDSCFDEQARLHFHSHGRAQDQ